MSATSENGWFWKIFGPAIIGIISILFLTIFNHLNGTISNLRTDMLSANTELRNELKKVGIEELTRLREKVAALEEKINVEIKNGDIDKERLDRIKEKVTQVERIIDLHTEQISNLKEKIHK